MVCTEGGCRQFVCVIRCAFDARSASGFVFDIQAMRDRFWLAHGAVFDVGARSTLGRCVFGVRESLVDVCATIVGRLFYGYAMTVRRSVHARLMIARRSAMLVLRTLLSPSRV